MGSGSILKGGESEGQKTGGMGILPTHALTMREQQSASRDERSLGHTPGDTHTHTCAG